jgi:predicted nucleic acid-binding protein
LQYPKLNRIHGLSIEEIENFLEDLTAFAFFTPEELTLTVISEDPSDDKYLVCATEGNAEYIISGDSHLLQLGNWEGIKVITAKDFLEASNYD